MSGPVARVRRKKIEENRPGWGLRTDGAAKGEGWLGILKRPTGGISTEITAGVQIGGRETEIPLIVPTLSAEEVKWLLSADLQAPDFYQHLPSSIMKKAIAHAEQRIKAGKSPLRD